MRSLQPAFLERRGAAALVFGLFVAGGLVFLFAGTFARATELEAQAAAARAELAALQQRLDDGRAEIEFIRTDAFIEHQARAEGFGRPGETFFQLPADAPPPPLIVPLGAAASDDAVLTPLDAWIELLFGS